MQSPRTNTDPLQETESSIRRLPLPPPTDQIAKNTEDAPGSYARPAVDVPDDSSTASSKDQGQEPRQPEPYAMACRTLFNLLVQQCLTFSCTHPTTNHAHHHVMVVLHQGQQANDWTTHADREGEAIAPRAGHIYVAGVG